MAVGWYDNNGEVPQILAESWDGTAWSVILSSSPGNGGQLYGVSCPSSTSCVAVGYYDDETLVESWDGTAWSVVPSPSPGTFSNVLTGVSCTNSTSCLAVGNYSAEPNGGNQTLVESWDGTAWSVVPSPSPGTSDSILTGVSCTSSTSCVAVGYYSNGSANLTLVESWDGAALSVVPSPNPGTFPAGNSLNGVSCTSSTSCVAVGLGNQTLVETWDGTAWFVTPSANQGSQSDLLWGVSCTSSVSCVAVGYYANGSATLTLVEAWDGSTWSITPSPNPSGSGDLYGVSCTSSTNCVAAGVYWNGSDPSQTLIESGYTLTWIIAATSGTPQSTLVNTAFAAPLTATVTDAYGNPVPGAVVSFTAPTGGASGTFANGTTTDTETTNASGVASSTSFSANTTAGSYAVDASVAGLLAPATFSLTNNLGPAASIAATSGTPQSTLVNTAFAAPLTATVTDAYGNPVPGAVVSFTAPTGGASGTFANGTTTDTETTNASGVASSTSFSANTAAGSYAVDASVAGLLAPATFSLTNLSPAPTIKKFSPRKGRPGKEVTITGTNLSGATSVRFNRTLATITTNTATKITTTVPTRATTGKIQVTTAGGTATSRRAFKVT